MPQLSPLKWFNLYIFILTISMIIIIKMNYLFLNKLSKKKKNNLYIYQMKWKI
uniref:ATP synthase F0 subunit 8 n=1 Tax=Vespa ducalis TaxID=1075778 RepID=A0A343B783_VESDU|nr:ATP synthase F0 subunit 8 [Vespa ducalis]